MGFVAGVEQFGGGAWLLAALLQKACTWIGLRAVLLCEQVWDVWVWW